MNALLVICGLGIISLVAEIANFRKWLISIIVLGLLGAAALIVADWNTAVSYYHDMLVFDNLSLAFAGLIVVISLLWFWTAGDFFDTLFHKTDKSALIL